MFFEETVQFFRRVDARTAIGYVLAALGDGARAAGQMLPARERLDESLAHFRELGDDMGAAFALNRIGILAGVAGERDYGAECLEEALALRRERGDRRGIGITLGNLGVLAARGGDLERGRALLAEAQASFERTSDVPGMTGMRLNLGQLLADARRAGDGPRAARGQRGRARTSSACSAAPAGWTSGWPSSPSPRSDAERAGELLGAARRRLGELGDRWGLAWASELEQAAAKRSLSPSRARLTP